MDEANVENQESYPVPIFFPADGSWTKDLDEEKVMT